LPEGQRQAGQKFHQKEKSGQTGSFTYWIHPYLQGAHGEVRNRLILPIL
jgi:hypothetical protein